MLGAMDYGFEHLPAFIDTSLYAAFTEALEPEAVEAAMQENLALLEADETGEVTQFVTMDPLGLRNIFLKVLMPEDGSSTGGFTIEDGHFFCPDKTVALAFMDPSFPSLDTDRSGNLAFRVLGAEWMDPQRLIRDIEDDLHACGLSLREYHWGKIAGVLLSIDNLKHYRPAVAAMTLLKAIRRRWAKPLASGAREEWLVKLMGGTSFDPAVWRRPLAAYAKKRVNLY